MIGGVYDVVEGRIRACEIDVTQPRCAKMRDDLEVPANAPNLEGWSPEGRPILRYWQIARDFERQMLAVLRSHHR